MKNSVKKSDSSERTYIKGSCGGCYYMNGDKRVYVKDKVYAVTNYEKE